MPTTTIPARWTARSIAHTLPARRYSDVHVEASLQLSIYSYATAMLGFADQEDLRLRFDVITKTRQPELHWSWTARDRAANVRQHHRAGRLEPRRNRGQAAAAFQGDGSRTAARRLLGPKTSWAGAQSARQAATKLSLELQPVEHHPTDPQVSFAAIGQLAVDGLFVASSPALYAQQESIGRLAIAARVPVSVSGALIVEAGALMSYAPDLLDLMRKVAHYVDRILKGANPGEMPMELSTRFELVINRASRES